MKIFPGAKARLAGEPAQFWGPKSATPSRPRLLLISYHFPPGQSVGVLRWQRLSSHAAEFGWELDVITLHPSGLSSADMSRLAELPLGTRVYGIATGTQLIEHLEHSAWRLFRSRHPNAPSPRAGSLDREEMRWSRRDFRAWLRRAYYAWIDHSRYRHWAKKAATLGSRLVEPTVHRAVVSSGPPHMAHEAACRVARRKGLPLVMDLRDPWSLMPRLSEDLASPIWFALAARYERRAVATAALVVMNTEPARLAMQAAHPEAAGRIIAVMNGYDEEPVPRSRHGSRFTIVYAGTIYLARDPRPVFRAIAEVVRRLGLTPEEFGIELIGRAQSYNGMPIETIAHEAGIEAFVRTRPPRPRHELMEILADATVLLSLPQGIDMTIPAKIFEYMKFDAWILALAPPGSATELLLRQSTADVVSPDNVQDIANVLKFRYQQYRQGQRPSRLAQSTLYSRREQAKLLFEAIEKSTDGHARDSQVTPNWLVPLVRRAAKRIERAKMLRRMRKVARSPAELAGRVARARTIYFVCHGNIIRSAFAAALLRDRIGPLSDTEVCSAGLGTSGGAAAHPFARQCARQFGIDLTTHLNQGVRLKELLRTDVVFAMEADQLVDLERRFPECRGKAYLLGCLDPDGRLEIGDPVSAPVETFQACFLRIEAAIRRLVDLLVPAAGSPTTS